MVQYSGRVYWYSIVCATLQYLVKIVYLCGCIYSPLLLWLVFWSGVYLSTSFETPCGCHRSVETCRSEHYIKRKYCDIYVCVCVCVSLACCDRGFESHRRRAAEDHAATGIGITISCVYPKYSNYL